MFERFGGSRFGRTIRFLAASGTVAALLLLGAFFLLPVFWEPPRFEQEYKIEFSGALTSEVQKEVYDRIGSELPKRHWKNDDVLSGSYYMGSDLDTTVFEDLYFDTAEGLLNRENISYRLRYRWKTIQDLRSYRETGISPQRLEFQTKAYPQGTVADINGYKRALKNRYEIKNDYRLNPVTSLLLRRQYGESLVRFLGQTPLGEKFTPVTLVKTTLAERGIANFDFSTLSVAVRVVTERTRFHINKKTPFGSGDNPDNAILVTLDRSKIYADDRYQNELGGFSEIEVDFERNTFHRLFDSAYAGGQDSLKPVIASFEEDQATVKDLIVSVLKERGYEISPPEGASTKYQKAREISP